MIDPLFRSSVYASPWIVINVYVVQTLLNLIISPDPKVFDAVKDAAKAAKFSSG